MKAFDIAVSEFPTDDRFINAIFWSMFMPQDARNAYLQAEYGQANK